MAQTRRRREPALRVGRLASDAAPPEGPTGRHASEAGTERNCRMIARLALLVCFVAPISTVAAPAQDTLVCNGVALGDLADDAALHGAVRALNDVERDRAQGSLQDIAARFEAIARATRDLAVKR